MNLQYMVAPVSELPEDIYKWCRRHNFGSQNGSMYNEVIECRKNPSLWSRAIVLWDSDQPVGWALMFKESLPTWTDEHYKYINVITAYFWVTGPNRRKGYGTILYKLARVAANKKKIKVHGWDNRSESFFDHVSSPRPKTQLLQA